MKWYCFLDLFFCEQIYSTKIIVCLHLTPLPNKVQLVLMLCAGTLVDRLQQIVNVRTVAMLHSDFNRQLRSLPSNAAIQPYQSLVSAFVFRELSAAYSTIKKLSSLIRPHLLNLIRPRLSKLIRHQQSPSSCHQEWSSVAGLQLRVQDPSAQRCAKARTRHRRLTTVWSVVCSNRLQVEVGSEQLIGSSVIAAPTGTIFVVSQTHQKQKKAKFSCERCNWL